jgi:hypothetical protein
MAESATVVEFWCSPGSTRHRSSHAKVGRSIILLGALSGCAVSEPPASAVMLRLEELASWPLDNVHAINGARIIGESLLAWSSREGTVVLIRDGISLSISRPGTLPVAADLYGGELVVLQGNPAALVGLSLNGMPIWEKLVQLPSPPQSAVRVGEEWYVTVFDQNVGGLYRVDASTAHGRSVRVIPLESPSHVGRVGTGIVLLDFREPFRIRRLTTDGAILSSHRPDYAHSDSLILPNPSAWVALPGVSLGSGALLQTIANLTSDDRLFLRYGEEADGPEHTTLTHVPMGFLHSDPKSRRALAVRDVGRVELVLYEWRWGEAGTFEPRR